MAVDRLYLHHKKELEGITKIEPLMRSIMEKGKVIMPLPSIEAIKDHRERCMTQFPEEYKRLRNPEIYWLGLSPQLADMKEHARAKAG